MTKEPRPAYYLKSADGRIHRYDRTDGHFTNGTLMHWSQCGLNIAVVCGEPVKQGKWWKNGTPCWDCFTQSEFK